MKTLYIVATPIGNLEDVTKRALRVLKEVAMILCEDTRVTKRLLAKYEIQTPTLSYHVRSGLKKVEKIVALLEEENELALVTDAGTPTISDPGVLLIENLRKHFEHDIRIIPIPGPCAAITALSASGLPSSNFTFYGFLPHKKGRESLLKEITLGKRTSVFYESPHRISKTLATLSKNLNEVRTVVVARELTKIHEEIIHASARVVHEYFIRYPEKVRGEFVVIVEGAH